MVPFPKGHGYGTWGSKLTPIYGARALFSKKKKSKRDKMRSNYYSNQPVWEVLLISLSFEPANWLMGQDFNLLNECVNLSLNSVNSYDIFFFWISAEKKMTRTPFCSLIIVW